MKIELSKETKAHAVHQMREYLAEEHDLELGNLGAELLIDHFVQLVGPAIYNLAVTDVQTWLQTKLSDLDSDVFRAPPSPRKR